MSQGFARGTPGATGTPGPAGAAGAGASGAHLFELAPIASPRFLGRSTAGSGVIEEIDTPTAVGMLPVFSLVAKGLVPAPVTAAGLFLRDDATWAAAGAAGRPSGVTLGEQAVAPPLTVQGRFTIGTGTREDLSPGSVASLIGGGWGSGMQLLKAPTGGVQGRLLRDDGIWVQPSFVASGIALAQLGALSPLKVVGRFTAGSGAPEQLSGDQVASMIGKFAGTGLGLVPTPTGGSLGRLLRDDGAWVTPSFVASGVALAQQGDLSPLRVVGRFTLGSGTPEQLTQGQVASLLPVFSATGTPGLVPQPSAAASGMFLRDDGKWASPTGLGNGQFAFMPPSTIKGRSGSTGLPEDLVPSAVATMLPLFNNIDKGLVPGSGGGTANFLRADGQWAGPSVAAGVSGVTFAQLQDISAPRFVGRFVGSGSQQELTPLSAASMLPLYQGSGFGIVPAATGGNVRSFLRDDGQWQIPLASGIANAALGAMPPLTIKGRFTLGSGVPEDISAGQVASLLPPFFASGARGVVLGPTGGAVGNYLRDDGSWQAVSAQGGGGPTMLAAGPAGAVQYNGGSGFAGATGFRFDAASGTLLLNGALSIPSGSVELGGSFGPVPASGLIRVPHGLTFITSVTSSGLPAAIADWGSANERLLLGDRNQTREVQAQAIPTGQMLLRFGSNIRYSIYDDNANLSGRDLNNVGALSAFKLGLTSLRHTASTDKLGAITASGFANVATGILTKGSGVGLDLVGLTVASLSAPVFGAAVGLVPTASSAGLFLKDDATWATPAAGAATGISNAMQLAMPPFTLSGRSTLGSGIPEDLTLPQVASLIPRFTASGVSAGLVSPPTGGASGYFLQDDGSFYNIMPRNERLIGNVGSSIGSGFVVGSSTVDFSVDPYQSLNLFGSTKFTLTPPTRHRHVQLRMVVGGSGVSPTFFPSMVKWMGGSGSVPAWSTASGAVNFANFFYDGSIMWGQAGVGAG